MRDVVLAAFIFGSLPFILLRPWLGVAMYIWVSVMNPHRLTWGFAYEIGFASIIATVTLPFVIVSGMWGMNFQHIPMSDYPHGFWILLGVQVLIGLFLLGFLRLRRYI